MNRKQWDLWKKNPMIERRTFLRAKGTVPEMECTKQLIKIIKPIYKKEMSILDVGCAAGHYFNAVKKLNKNVNYLGIDENKTYINFAKKFYKNSNAKFRRLNIYDLKQNKINKHDIVYCCNVLLHLPEIFIPLKNLLKVILILLILFTFLDAISLALSAPSLSTLSINFSSFNNLLILDEMGEILSTTKLANFSLNSEKFFPENSLIV